MSSKELKDLSQKIVCFRAKNNINQEEFASRCHLTQQTICNIENEKQKPTKLTKQKILNVINEG